jgi:hypothetical protein
VRSVDGRLAADWPGDRHEFEADRAADAVMARSAGTVLSETVPQSGRSLQPAVRALMESHFGYDFSRVRIYSDASAAAAAKSRRALAFTAGTDVVFAPGQYAPGTPEGQRLLAHELAHVVQQGNRQGVEQRQKSGGGATDPLLAEVDGVKIIGTGSSSAAVKACADIVRELVDNNKYAQKKLKQDKVTLVIIPHNKKMTELPQFKSLAGIKTFDGRWWDN